MSDFAAWYARARAALHGGRFVDAEAALREALNLRPDDVQACLDLAVVLRRLRRAGDAEAIVRAALVSRPELSSLHYELGVALFEQGRFADAASSFRFNDTPPPEFYPVPLNDGLLL